MSVAKIITIIALPFGMWRSWLAHHVRDVGVGRSSRLIPTKAKKDAGSTEPASFFAFYIKLYQKRVALSGVGLKTMQQSEKSGCCISYDKTR